jgi:hypothetical protein
MIKTALKHYLYEFCINQIFNGVKRNFITVNKSHCIRYGNHMQNVLNIKIGDVFDCILLEPNPFFKTYFYGAKIVDIHPDSIIISGNNFTDYHLTSKQIVRGSNYNDGVLLDRICWFGRKI